MRIQLHAMLLFDSILIHFQSVPMFFTSAGDRCSIANELIGPQRVSFSSSLTILPVSWCSLRLLTNRFNQMEQKLGRVGAGEPGAEIQRAKSAETEGTSGGSQVS